MSGAAGTPGADATPAAAPAAAPVAAPAAAVPVAAVAAPAAPATPAVAAPAPVVAPAATAPEKYDAFTLPQGLALSEQGLAEVHALAKDLGLTQDAAAKLATSRAQSEQALHAQLTGTLETAKQQWQTESRADKEIGGANYDANVAAAGKVFDIFGDEGLKTLLDGTGLSAHPAIQRWAFRISQAISPDKFVRADRGAQTSANDPLEARAISKLWPTGT